MDSISEIQKLKNLIEFQKEQLELLYKSEKKYKQFFHLYNNALFIVDFTGAFIEVNQFACDRYGYSFEEFSKLSFFDFYSDLDKNLISEKIKSIGENTYANFESKHFAKNGQVFPVEILVHKFDHGSSEAILIICTEISNKQKLEFEKDLLYALMDNIPDTIYFKDTESKFTLVNSAQAKLLGVKNCEDAIGKSDSDFFPQNHAEEAYKDEQELFNTGLPLISKPERIRHSSGNYKWVTATKVPIFDANGEATGLVGISRDITELKEAENKILKYTNELQYLNASKDKFFSIIAHDLKNPFISLLGFSEILLEDYDTLSNDERFEYIHNIYSASKNSFQLLDNLLQWSRAQTGRIDYCPIEIDFKKLAEECLTVLVTTATKKRIKIINNFGNSIFVYADPDMAKTVIRNLITNALKFTNEGGVVSITAAIQEDYLLTVIEDNGVGMDADTAEKLFRIDVHHSACGTSNEVGTGLGLILCKEFIEKNGGKIWFESELGKGSRFFFTLPLHNNQN
jgi:PAS domain S-box-containing protein